MTAARKTATPKPHDTTLPRPPSGKRGAKPTKKRPAAAKDKSEKEPLPSTETNLIALPFQPFPNGQLAVLAQPRAEPGPNLVHDADTSTDRDTGRDAKGRFAKGNRGGPGNPFMRRAALLRRAFVEQVTENRLAQLADQLFAQAMGGDMAAAKLLLAYGLGLPVAVADPDAVEQHAWQLLRSRPTGPEVLTAILDGLDIERVVELLGMQEANQDDAKFKERLFSKEFMQMKAKEDTLRDAQVLNARKKLAAGGIGSEQ